MSYNETISVRAGADLRAKQYFAVEIDGTLSGAPLVTAGILANKPNNGEDATIVYAGRSKFRAGGTVTAGGLLTVNSTGYFTAASSTNQVVGKCEIAANSGSITHGIFNFANAGYYA
jgi:hypothetical protein